ncbi:MAG: hypothetical protein RL026_738 [Pseudomonadota bacterium]|jgi:AraC-like DNA-binding protein
MPQVAAPLLSTVCTRVVPPRDRLPMWGDYVWRHIGKLQSDAFGDVAFDGSLDYADIGRMKIARIRASRHRVIRQPKAMADSVGRYLKLALQLKGCSTYQQHGRLITLLPGQWSAYDTSRPYIVTNPEPVEQLAVLIPADDLPGDIDISQVSARVFSGSTGIGRLVYQSITSVFEELPTLARDRAEDLGDVVSRLVQLALYEKLGKAQPQSQHADLRDRILSYVESHLQDPRLSLDRIAADLHCTKRYLHMVFSTGEQTLNDHIWARRLERCRADLGNPAMRERSVTDIALSWGFSNPSHFSRAFRARFGIPPSATRG